MKIRTVRTKLLHAGGQAGGRTVGHEEAKIRFSQFCEHTKKKKRFGSAISVIRFRRSCSCIIGFLTDCCIIWTAAGSLGSVL